MMSLLLDIMFFFMGMGITSFILCQSLICLYFAVPLTKKLKNANLINHGNNILKKYYLISVITFLLFSGILLFLYKYTIITHFVIVCAGSFFVLPYMLSQCRLNVNNLSDYLENEKENLIETPNEIIDFILGK